MIINQVNVYPANEKQDSWIIFEFHSENFIPMYTLLKIKLSSKVLTPVKLSGLICSVLNSNIWINSCSDTASGSDRFFEFTILDNLY